MSKLFDKAIIYSMAGITRNTAQDVASALAEDLTPSEVMSFNPDAVSTALNVLGMPLSNGEVAVSVAIILNKVLATKPAADPGEGLWRSFGFTQPIPVDEEIYGDDPAMAVGIAGVGAVLLCVEIRERVLPSASINDALTERVAAFEEKEGRLAVKKDIAMLKDEITARMLKTAPIRRKRVPVLLAHGLCVMFTTSYKLSDDIGALLRKLFGTWPVSPVFTDSLQPWMHGLIYDKKLPLDEMIKAEALLPEYAGYGFVGEGEQLADLEDLIKQELDEDEEWEDDEL